jgi:hypothetical protein
MCVQLNGLLRFPEASSWVPADSAALKREGRMTRGPSPLSKSLLHVTGKQKELGSDFLPTGCHSGEPLKL